MNQLIGYTRVSTDNQHLDLQRDALQQAGCSVIYEGAASGKNVVRPELVQCCRALRSGDTLVIWRLDRLGRSLPDLVWIVTELAGVGLASTRARGRPGGRKRKLDDQRGREIKALLRDSEIKVAEVARRYGESRTTLYKHVGLVTVRH